MSDSRRAGVRRRRDGAAGVYIHVPFCERVCPYCDFAVTAVREIPHRAYADALIAELDARSGALEGRDLRTIYVGGGTPSRLDPAELARVIEHARRFASGVLDEVTIEANPVDVTPERMSIWKEAGIDRVSLGCQSFSARVLERLGRNHSGALAVESIERLLGEGFLASIDLIFGAPEQTEEEWASDLEIFVRLVRERGLSHLSAYNLTIEEATPYARMVARGELVIPGEDECVRFGAMLEEAASGVGIAQYEVSSWSSPGAEAVHNSSYWRGSEYLGVGVGAHSLEVLSSGEVVRASNTRHLREYLRRGHEASEREELSVPEHFEERVFVGLRSRIGLDLKELSHQFGAYYESREEGLIMRLDALVERALLERFGGGNYRPTRAGLMVADAIGSWALAAG